MTSVVEGINTTDMAVAQIAGEDMLGVHEKPNGEGTVLPFSKKRFTLSDVLKFRNQKLNFGGSTTIVNKNTGKQMTVGWDLKETPTEYQLVLTAKKREV